MLTNTAPPTDQRSQVKPISFVLQRGTAFGAPVTLKIRPSDLVRQEPSRTSVHQTLGREVSGWADNFGLALPSCTISGHTGWRAGGVSGLDGAQAFEQLNNLVTRDYHDARQAAIQGGQDPASVKLLFVDTLDNFCWNVAPLAFELRRNRSNPLLFMYNMRLQAISTDIDNPLTQLPFSGTVAAGLTALGGIIGRLESFGAWLQTSVATGLKLVDELLAPVALIAQNFYRTTLRVYRAVATIVGALNGGVTGVANDLIAIASDLSRAGINIFRTISAITGLPTQIKSQLMRVAGAYNEAFCIFRNSLRPRKVYLDYDDLYGASNCSSTTGGRGMSPLSNSNPFDLMFAGGRSFSASSDALSSLSTLNRADPVLVAPDYNEMGRHMDNISQGVRVDE